MSCFFRDLELVSQFLRLHQISVPAPFRILDIVSEFAELDAEMHRKISGPTVSDTISEEIGDLYFSLLAFTIENNLEITEISAITEDRVCQSIQGSLGNLSKEILRTTNYGQAPENSPTSDRVRDIVRSLFQSIKVIVHDNELELSNCLENVLDKYNERFRKNATMDSRG